jgi:hypothetical protein
VAQGVPLKVASKYVQDGSKSRGNMIWAAEQYKDPRRSHYVFSSLEPGLHRE